MKSLRFIRLQSRKWLFLGQKGTLELTEQGYRSTINLDRQRHRLRALAAIERLPSGQTSMLPHIRNLLDCVKSRAAAQRHGGDQPPGCASPSPGEHRWKEEGPSGVGRRSDDDYGIRMLIGNYTCPPRVTHLGAANPSEEWTIATSTCELERLIFRGFAARQTASGSPLAAFRLNAARKASESPVLSLASRVAPSSAATHLRAPFD